ncbi:hypothetical protein [Streptomyces sp. SudanB25_2051]|uniref:hypothetical protein n=1 Tax=Streptomyces sp. SudanB25_2051 TaxID=3035275 RepID=UPI003F54F2DA
MDAREDFQRTVQLLSALALYAHTFGADPDFVDAVGPALAVSLPEPPPDAFPSRCDPHDGPQHPGGQP